MTFEYRSSITKLLPTADIVVFTSEKPCEGFEQAIIDACKQGTSGFVLRTTPYEAGYLCDTITAVADCAYNNAFAVTANALTAIGGADIGLGEATATDMCKRLVRAGFEVKYVPNAIIECNKSPKPSYDKLVISSVLMRVKYGSIGDIWQGKIFVLKALLHPDSYNVNRVNFFTSCFKMLGKAIKLFFARASKNKQFKNSINEWYGVELGFARGEYVPDGIAFCAGGENNQAQVKAKIDACKQPENENGSCPLVSVITRTRNRPETLRKTLESLRLQTYKSFEVVVVEDGEPLCEQMIEQDFSDLIITYKATVKNVGRASAFNLGVSLARGELINMLDDDDFLAPDHLELCVAKIYADSLDVVFTSAIAIECEKISDAPYEFEIKRKMLLDVPRFEPFTMVRRCLATAHGVMLKKEICNIVGGMRLELGAHEDWNLWLRIMCIAKYKYVHYATNYYVVPHSKQLEQERQEKYSKFDDEILNDDTLLFKTTPDQLKGYYKSVIDDYLYLHTIGLLGTRLASDACAAREFVGKTKNKPASFEMFCENKEVTLSGIELKQLYCTLILKFEQKQKSNELISFLTEELSALGKKK